RSACKRALRAQLIRLGQNVQAERAERAGSLVDKVEAITAGKLEIAIIEPSGKKSIDLAVFVPVFEGLYRGFAAEPVLADRYGFSVVDITTAAIT
ncbi:hypothetical protein PtrSN001C_012150, partial [Pyrenophora tritici-repentis]